MAMDNMSVRRAHLEKLDEFVHKLYQETQTFKQYGLNLEDLEVLYLHIHEVIEDLLACDTTDEFMAKMAELSKGIAGVLIIAMPGSAQQIVDQLKGAHEAMSDVDVDDFLKNMKVKEKSAPPPDTKPQSEEEREKDKEDLIDTLGLEKQVKESKPGKKKADRPWGKNKAQDEVTTTEDDTHGNEDLAIDDEDNEEEVPPTAPNANDGVDPLNDLWKQWDNK